MATMQERLIELENEMSNRGGPQCRANNEHGGWSCRLRDGHEGAHAAILLWPDVRIRPTPCAPPQPRL